MYDDTGPAPFVPTEFYATVGKFPFGSLMDLFIVKVYLSDDHTKIAFMDSFGWYHVYEVVNHSGYDAWIYGLDGVKNINQATISRLTHTLPNVKTGTLKDIDHEEEYEFITNKGRFVVIVRTSFDFDIQHQTEVSFIGFQEVLSFDAYPINEDI